MATGGGSLIAQASSIIRRRGAVLFGLSLWPFALSFIGIMLLVRTVQPAGPDAQWDPVHVWKSMSWLMRCTWIVCFLSYFYLSPMLALAGISEIVTAEQGRTELSLGDVLGRVVRALPRLIGLSFAVGILATFGFEAFVLPGLAVLAITTFAVPAIMLEGKSMRAAWRRSASLVRQGRGGVVALGGGLALTLIAIFCVVFALGSTSPEAGKFAARVSLLLIPAPVSMVFGTLDALLFLDIRERASAAARAASGASS